MQRKIYIFVLLEMYIFLIWVGDEVLIYGRLYNYTVQTMFNNQQHHFLYHFRSCRMTP